MKKIFFIANNNIGNAMSGGDRIFTELMRGWQKHAEITLIGCEEAFNIVEAAGVKFSGAVLTDGKNSAPDCETLGGLVRHMLRRLRKGFRAIGDNSAEIAEADAIYSVSDFYPDVLPAFSAKRRNPGIKWIAGYYLFAPSPFDRNSPYRGRHFVRGLIYWLMQRLSYFLVKRYADYVFVTSEPDVPCFVTRNRDRTRIVVVRGGVDVSASEKYLSSGTVIPVDRRKYDACFVGRFHHQKGVVELMDIWRMVVEQKQNAKLALIGVGPLESVVRERITSYGLGGNIDLLGFMDGDRKYEVFKQSKMILHPATYDSGGMAAAEGMAWGLPAICFDLDALKTYYPTGALKSKNGNLRDFADNIMKLLNDGKLREEYSKEAHSLVLNEWDWRKRADFAYSSVFQR